jgi:hypothetical protein
MTHLTNDAATRELSINELDGVAGGALKDVTVKGVVDAALVGAVGGIIGGVVASGVVGAPVGGPVGGAVGAATGALGYVISKFLD